MVTTTTIDAAISELASTQHGVVTRRQLRELGLGDSAISDRASRGRLHRLHRGVFAVGHRAPNERTEWMGAVLAAGAGAVLDLQSAARLHGLERISRRRRRIKPSVLVAKRHAAIDGVQLRHTRSLPDGDVTSIDGIPVVTMERLLVNLAADETPSVLCKLIDEAAYLGVLDLTRLRSTMDRLRSRRGHESIARALHDFECGSHGTDSELEERALRFCLDAGVSPPEVNVHVVAMGERMRVDQCWRRERVIQEVDGVGHGRPTRQRADRRRRARLRAAGWHVLVVTAHDLDDPASRQRAGRRLRAVLAQ